MSLWSLSAVMGLYCYVDIPDLSSALVVYFLCTTWFTENVLQSIKAYHLPSLELFILKVLSMKEYYQFLILPQLSHLNLEDIYSVVF